LDDILG